MKTRIASSLALAAAIALGASGCAMMAPQGTTDPYAPSDGINLTVSKVDVRNLLLIAAEDGVHFNVVFTTVNNASEAKELRFDFLNADGVAVARANFTAAPGVQEFGRPGTSEQIQAVKIPDVMIGSMIKTFVQVSGAEDVQRMVPVLDGTLADYRPFVLKDIPSGDPATDAVTPELENSAS